jgi:hypothetical protein
MTRIPQNPEGLQRAFGGVAGSLVSAPDSALRSSMTEPHQVDGPMPSRRGRSSDAVSIFRGAVHTAHLGCDAVWCSTAALQRYATLAWPGSALQRSPSSSMGSTSANHFRELESCPIVSGSSTAARMTREISSGLSRGGRNARLGPFFPNPSRAWNGPQPRESTP